MNVKYYLKDPKTEGETVIYLLLHYGLKEKTTGGKEKYKPVKIYLKDKINPKYWNPEKGKARETSKFPTHPEFNQNLANIASDIQDLCRTLKNNGRLVTPALIKSEWAKLTEPEPVKKESDFVEFVETFIGDERNRKKGGTIQTYEVTLTRLKEFAKLRKILLTFDNIGLDFFLSFVDYLTIDLKYQPNTIWKYAKILKTFLNEATEKGEPTNLDFKKKRFTIKPVETDVIYLNSNDLSKIYGANLTNKPKLDRVRDTFLIGCYTGLRFSDLSKLTTANIVEFEGKKMLRIRTQKTDQLVTIPINPVINGILTKYGDKLPKVITNQKFNEYLKTIAEIAGLDEVVAYEKNTGKIDVSKPIKKYQLVTAHTARRSLATNAYLAKIPVIDIMKLTGHKTEKAFLRYIRISNDENALNLSTHDFFNTVPLKIAE